MTIEGSLKLEDLPEDALVISHSQVNVWNDCRMKWFFNYHEGWTKKEPNLVMRKGNLGHEQLASHYHYRMLLQNGVKPDSNFDPINNVAKQQAVDAKSYDEIKILAEAGKIVKRYLSEFAPKRDKSWKILGVEEHFVIPLTTPTGRQYYLQGYIDLLVNENGNLAIVDHKFTGRFWTPVQMMMDVQLAVYVASLRQLGIKINTIYFNQLNSYDYKNPDEVSVEKMFRRDSTYRTDVELDSILYEFGLVVDEMLTTETYRRSLSKDCKNCQFQEPCLMGLKGMDTEIFLNAKFVKKASDRTAVEDVFASADIETNGVTV